MKVRISVLGLTPLFLVACAIMAIGNLFGLMSVSWWMVLITPFIPIIIMLSVWTVFILVLLALSIIVLAIAATWALLDGYKK